ncbi:MAG: MFS transporter [Kofleriaceae bacterium]|nr:MFS transporter [Kofleriaceae bacterium]
MTAQRSATHILVVLALINLIAYAARNALVAVYPTLAARYGIDYEQIGLLQTVYMIPHAAATLPFGWAGDAYDRRRVIVFGLVLASIAGALGAIGSEYLGLAASRAFVGLGTAAVVPVANSILSQLYEGPKKAARLSIFNLGLFLGGVVGFAGGAIAGFPLVVIVLGLPGIALGLVLLQMSVPAHPTPPPSVRWWRYLAQFTRRFAGEARVLMKIRTLRWLMLSTTAMAFTAGAYNAFMIEFLRVEKGMSEGAATNLLVIAMFGGLAGIILGGRFADRLRVRYANGRAWMIVIGMMSSIPCTALAISLPAGPALYVAGVATLFCFSLYHAPMAATVDDLAPPGKSVAAQGLVIGTMHLLGTAPSSWVLGAVSVRTSLYTAMWVPTATLLLAAGAMLVATRSFEADHARARPK